MGDKIKLGNLTLRNLKGTGARRDVGVEGYPGLQVRVSGDGKSKTYGFLYRQDKKLQRVTIGDCGEIRIADVLEMHGKMRRLALDGDDPRKALPETRPLFRKTSGFTVRDIAEEFRERHLLAVVDPRNGAVMPVNAAIANLKGEAAEVAAAMLESGASNRDAVLAAGFQPNLKDPAEPWRIIQKDILPAWGDRGANTIIQRDAILLLDEVRDRGSRRMAERVRSLLIQLFKFGVGRGTVEASPMVNLEKPTKKSDPRDRILTDDELRAFWSKLETAKMLPRLRHALRLLLITGQRRGEVALATWSEFDEAGKTWSIPGERTKNGKPHDVPLTPLALRTLASLRADLAQPREDAEEGYTGPFLFPSPHREKAEPIDPKALTRAISRNRAHWGIEPFTVHDLRRTVRSNLSPLGVDPVVAKKIMNHSLAGMDRIYDRHSYADEKRAALTLWADRLAAVVEGKRPKVEPIRRANV